MKIKLYTLLGGLFGIFYIIERGGLVGLLFIVLIVLMAAWIDKSETAIVHSPTYDKKLRNKTTSRPKSSSSEISHTRIYPQPSSGFSNVLSSGNTLKPNTLPLKDAISKLPSTLTSRSGALFYSGRAAFDGQSDLYVLGLNPGGSPFIQESATCARHISDWDRLPLSWSAYLDDSWEGKAPGTHGMQPRIAHMFKALGRDLRAVPASNVVFVRSTTEAALAQEKELLLRQCWPVHQSVIDTLGVRTILCFGTTAGTWLRQAIGANQQIGQFREQNNRGWKSVAHIAPDGKAVVTLTHPGRADWRNPAADPTSLVQAVLRR